MPVLASSTGSAQADVDPGLLVAWSGGGVAFVIYLFPPIVIGAPLSLFLWWNSAHLWDTLVGQFSLVPPFLEPPFLDAYLSLFWSSFALTSQICCAILVALVLILSLWVISLGF